MLCENCHQNEASIHYTEIINGVRTEHHICMECARKLKLTGWQDGADGEFPFVRLLTGLLSAGGNGKNLEDSPMMHVCCPGCGMSFDEFTTVGKFGCAECYGVFGPLIEDNMKRIHGDSKHRGKKYKKYIEHTDDNESGNDNTLPVMEYENKKENTDISELNKRLQEAVEIENFEEAARLRDVIKQLKADGIKDADKKQGGGQDA